MPWHAILTWFAVYYAAGVIVLTIRYWPHLGHWSDLVMIALGALIWPVILHDDQGK